MILYKYITFGTGKKIIETNSINFSKPTDFNDPFDLPSYPVKESNNVIEEYLEGVRAWAKNEIWADNIGILSLTRIPDNPLMWSHYADMHKGMVIGIDMITAELIDEDSNLIPAQYGSVIYVSKRPTGSFISKSLTAIPVGETYSFPQDHYEKLQRLFLHKSIHWAYEEEVRVVKCLHGLSKENNSTKSGNFRLEMLNGRTLYLFRLPENSIKEIYFGYRSDPAQSEDILQNNLDKHTQISVYRCLLDNDNLKVGYEKLQ